MSVFTKVENSTGQRATPPPLKEEPEEVREYHHDTHPSGSIHTNPGLVHHHHHHHTHPSGSRHTSPGRVPADVAEAHLHHHCSKDPTNVDVVPNYSRQEQDNTDHFLDQVHNHYTHNRHEGHAGFHETPVEPADFRDLPPVEPEPVFPHSAPHRVKGHVHQQSGKEKGGNDLFEDVHRIIELITGHDPK